MAEITPALRAQYGRLPDLIPSDIAKSIDQFELLDRLSIASDLLRRAQATGASPARGYGQRAGDILRAAPRAQTEARADAMLRKAAISNDPADAARLQAEAKQTLAQDPPAPRRAATARLLRKAAADGLVACYDADGNLVGTVDPAVITTLAPVKAPGAAVKEPADPADPDPVTKSARHNRAVIVRRMR